MRTWKNEHAGQLIGPPGLGMGTSIGRSYLSEGTTRRGTGMRSTRAMLRAILGAAGTAAILAGCAQQTVAEASDEVSSEQATFRVVPVVTGLEHPWGMAFLP